LLQKDRKAKRQGYTRRWYLHNSGVLPDPVVEGAGKLFKLFESSLCLGIEEGVAGRRLREHVIQLGHVGDDRLLVRFGGINICTTETNVRFFTPECRGAVSISFGSGSAEP